MKSVKIIGAALACISHFASPAVAVELTGTCPGFAYGVTGGGSADPVYPTTTDELTEYLTSDGAQVIILSGVYNYTGTEGSTTGTGCQPYGTDAGCQYAIDDLGMCDSKTTFSITYDTAGIEGINVKSDKTIIGTGTDTQIVGKGLRMVNVENIIIQNLAITDINSQYVWGGDALTLSGTSQIWMDHIYTARLGRQHYSFGQDASAKVTISNSYIDGQTDWSASCDGHTYWALELVGSADQISFVNNYVSLTSGRSPALSGTTLFHAVNSVWDSNSGHAIEGTDSGMGLFEGCYFNDVATVVVDDFVGQLFDAQSGNAGQCASALGRDCVANTLAGSGAFGKADTGFFGEFEGLTVAEPEYQTAEEAYSSVPSSAGNTLNNGS